MINIPDELITLSEIFSRNHETLFVVGGFVRDAIMQRVNLEHNDIDLASSCKPDKVVKMLKDSGFVCDDKNAKYGTVIITGNNKYEYTTFRRENYNMNGEHNPTGVEFVKDIHEDALRRDFTVNAIYYDIDKKEYIDPVYGLEDIKKKILRCPGSATESFRQDSERILRMIRFVNTLGFEVDQKTFEAAVEYKNGVQNLSKQRIRKEFDKMLVCDTFFPGDKATKYAHAKCLIMLGQFDLWQYILPAIDNIFSLKIKDDKGEFIYSHIINCVSVCEPQSRLACLLHDVGKVYTKYHHNTFNFSRDWAEVIIEQNLGQDGLIYPKEQIEKIKRTVMALDFDKHGFESKKSIRRFIRSNLTNFEDICNVKDAIALENTDYTKKSVIAARWKRIYHIMLRSNTPLKMGELKITGNEIIEAIPNIRLEKIKELQSKLFDMCLDRPKLNNTEILKQKAQKYALKHAEEFIEE